MNRNQSSYSEFNLLAGGDVTVRSVGTAERYLPDPVQFQRRHAPRRGQRPGSFMQGLSEAVIQDGGATIDTAGYAIDIVQALGGDGGLTKNGADQLTLQGTNTFTGNIQVNAGGLTLYSAHQGSGSVTCADSTTMGMNSSGSNLVVRLSAATVGSATGGTWDPSLAAASPGIPPSRRGMSPT